MVEAGIAGYLLIGLFFSRWWYRSGMAYRVWLEADIEPFFTTLASIFTWPAFIVAGALEKFAKWFYGSRE